METEIKQNTKMGILNPLGESLGAATSKVRVSFVFTLVNEPYHVELYR